MGTDSTSTDENQRRLILERGSMVVLHPDGPAGGFPRHAAVHRVRDGLHWFLGSCEPLKRGEVIMVEYPIPDDARYIAPATVEAANDETFALRLAENWDRAQQREFVRISTHGLDVRIVPADLEPRPWADCDHDEDGRAANGVQKAAHVYPLLDISAGGIRFRSREDFQEDDAVVCHFELPGSTCFVLGGRIVRSFQGSSTPVEKPEFAVEFQGQSEDVRGELLRWVYREQVKRHHAALRRAEQTP